MSTSPSKTESRPPLWRLVVATVGGYLSGIFGSFFFGSAVMVLAWIGPRGRLTLWLSQVWARIILFCSGVRVRAHFEVPLPPEENFVFLANHQSYFDIPALLVTIPNQVRFAAKRSLFKIPFFGWGLAAGGFIPIDRDDRARARESFQAAVERLKNGISVLFFPEGTRCDDGKLHPFERGGFLLALKSGLPVVPVGIRGARQALPRNRWWVSPGQVEIYFGAPIETASLGVKGRAALTAEVREKILALAKIEDTAVPGAHADRGHEES